MLRPAAALLAFLVCAVAIVAMWLLPAEHSPFGRIDLTGKIGAFTRLRIEAMKHDPQRCFAAAEAAALALTPLPFEEEGFCRLENAATITRSVHPYSQTVQVTCPLAAALYVWEREVLAPAAQRHFGMGIARIEASGSYACRRVYGQRTGAPSAHATGEAIDISGFRLEDGRVVTLARGWARRNEAEGRFLREVRTGGCRVFNTVLSPDYNRAHADHFHLQQGGYRICD